MTKRIIFSICYYGVLFYAIILSSARPSAADVPDVPRPIRMLHNADTNPTALVIVMIGLIALTAGIIYYLRTSNVQTQDTPDNQPMGAPPAAAPTAMPSSPANIENNAAQAKAIVEEQVMSNR